MDAMIHDEHLDITYNHLSYHFCKKNCIFRRMGCRKYWSRNRNSQMAVNMCILSTHDWQSDEIVHF